MLLHFDYDGVIVDSFDQLLAAAEKAVAGGTGARLPTREDFETMEDLTAAGIAMKLGVSEREIRLYVARMHAVLASDGYAPPFFPGIPEVLRSLAERHTIVVVTSNLTHLVQRALRQKQLEGCVSLILDALRPGTKCEKIQHALARFTASPEEGFMIGDTRGDIRHGKAAGVRTVAVTWGYQKRQSLEQEAPDYFVDSPRELLEVLETSE
jgi:phosphoglycolate phosphatase